jgi:RNA polymerase sigma factor (sigma-70 family)
MTDELDGLPPSVLETYFLENRPRLLAFLRHAGAGDQAEDLLQEAWLRLNGAPAARSGIAEPLSYLFRLLHNLVLDWRRGDIRARRRNEAWVQVTGSASAGVSEEPAGERVLIARATLAAAQRVLDELGEPTAGIFRRHRLGGITQRRIADELGIGLSTVEKHLRKAYRAMQDLAEAGDE